MTDVFLILLIGYIVCMSIVLARYWIQQERGGRMTEPRRLKRGQMFLNLWSGWQNIFVVLGTNNAYCYGVEVAKVKGEYRVCNVKYYLKDLRNDCEHFPLIGKMDVKAMWLDKVFERITADGREILNKNFDYYGHKIRVESDTE